MTKDNESTWIHPFELTGLGRAPFHFVQMVERVYQACHGAPVQPGGTCDHCGNGIRYCYQIRSADGRLSEVGCDCVRKTHDTALDAKVKAAKRTFRHAIKAQQWRDAETLRKESERDENERHGFERLSDDELRRRYNERREELWQHKIECERLDRERAKARSRHVGAVGKRGVFRVTIERTIVIENEYKWGDKLLYLLRDSNGNRLTWFCSGRRLRIACSPDDPRGWQVEVGKYERRAKDGETLQIRATVKKHDTYDGERQTVLSRVTPLT